MKRNILMITLAGSILLLFQSYYPKLRTASEIPDEVAKVISLSCYDCHSTDARNKDAREALNFEKWDDYRLTKKIGLMGDICKMVEGGKMPPEKYLTRKPDNKLTEEQKELICDWTKKESDKLMEGN